MTVAQFTQPNYTTQQAAAYKAAIDAAIAVLARQGGAFAPHEQDVGSPAPEMSMRVDAGPVFDGTTLTEVAAQTVSGFTSPASGYLRIDRVVIDAVTGVATRVAGTPQTVGSPTAVAPAIPAGKQPCCQIAFTDADTVITNSMITDERALLTLPAASDTAAGKIEIAIQSEMEAGSSTTLAVTPGRQHYHPSAAKAWAFFGVTGNLQASYNCSSVTDTGAGDATLGWSTAFSSGNYCANVTAYNSGGSNIYTHVRNISVNAIQVEARNTASAALTDPSGYFAVAHGDQ